MAQKVKTNSSQRTTGRVRRKGITRISSKNQATIPVDILRAAGLRPGDDVKIISSRPGEVKIVRECDIVETYAGKIRYPANYLDDLRDEWR